LAPAAIGAGGVMVRRPSGLVQAEAGRVLPSTIRALTVKLLVEVQDDAGQGALGRQGQGGVALDRLALGITFSFRSTCSIVTAASSAGIWPPVPRVRAVVGRAWRGHGLAGVGGVGGARQGQERDGAQGRGPPELSVKLGRQSETPLATRFSGDMGKLGHARRQAGSFRGGSSGVSANAGQIFSLILIAARQPARITADSSG
jgi:hypothetical protein